MLYKSNTFSIFFVNLEFCIVSLIACFWFFPNNADILKKVQGLLLKWMLILSYLVFMIKFGAHGKTLEPPLLSAARSSLKHWNSHGSKYVLSHGAATIGALSPANPPIYGPLINPSHPPKSSHFSIQFKKRSEWKPPISGFKNIAPIHSTEAAVPSVLAQPPLTPHASSKSSLSF